MYQVSTCISSSKSFWMIFEVPAGGESPFMASKKKGIEGDSVDGRYPAPVDW